MRAAGWRWWGIYPDSIARRGSAGGSDWWEMGKASDKDGIKIRVLYVDQFVSRPTPGPPLPLGEVVLIQVFVRLGRICWIVPGSYLDRGPGKFLYVT
jgi:hypothetical protein